MRSNKVTKRCEHSWIKENNMYILTLDNVSFDLNNLPEEASNKSGLELI